MPQKFAEDFDMAFPSEGRWFPWADQYDFRKGYVTCDALAALRVMCERSLVNNNKVQGGPKTQTVFDSL